MDGVEAAHDLEGTVLIIGFGRFGQVVSQLLLARGFDIAIIDTDTDMIRAATTFGFKIYYGDGCRLDVLHASGAGRARLIAACVDDRRTTSRIVELARHEFPQAKLLVRAFDREHAVELIGQGVDHLVRETFESAMTFGEVALRELGVDAEQARETAADIRRRDAERLKLDIAGGFGAGRHLLLGNAPKPTPYTTPAKRSQALSEETARVAATTDQQ